MAVLLEGGGQYLTVEQVSEVLGRPERTIRRLLRKPHVLAAGAVRAGRFWLLPNDTEKISVILDPGKDARYHI